MIQLDIKLTTNKAVVIQKATNEKSARRTQTQVLSLSFRIRPGWGSDLAS